MAVVPTVYPPDCFSLADVVKFCNWIKANGIPLDPGTAGTDPSVRWDPAGRYLYVPGATGGGLPGTAPDWTLPSTASNVVTREGAGDNLNANGTDRDLDYQANRLLLGGSNASWNIAPAVYNQVNECNLRWQVAELLWCFRQLVADLQTRGVLS